MVKRQKERQYESNREHRLNQQIRSGRISGDSSSTSKPLPFASCALSLVPFTTPVLSPKSHVLFEYTAIFPFVLQHKIDPVTGEPLLTKDLIKLQMSRNDEGQWQCPITTKPFSEFTKIVVVKDTVYSYEAYHSFNVKTNTFEDLITGQPFDPKSDVVVVYDPQQPHRDLGTFYHIVHARELEARSSKNSSNNNIHQNSTASRIMDKFKKRQAERKQQSSKKRLLDDATNNNTNNIHPDGQYLTESGQRLRVLVSDVTGVAYTGTAATSSLTSTGVAHVHNNAIREATTEEIRARLFAVLRKRKRKGYVKLHVNSNNNKNVVVGIQLHCDIAPRTCTNFLGLCRNEKYNGTIFHRLIPQFMIQGGKPSSQQQQQEEDSYFGGTFVDEFDSRLTHKDAGVVAMANAGAHTNKMQFYITFASATHLDRKHSVFGTVLNPEVLKVLERIPTDTNTNEPEVKVKITKTEIVEDPVLEAKRIEDARLEKAVAEREGYSTTKRAAVPTKKTNNSGGGVGKYLKLSASAPKPGDTSTPATATPSVVKRGPPPPKKTKFGNFSGW